MGDIRQISRFDGVTIDKAKSEADVAIPSQAEEVTIKHKEASMNSGQQTFSITLGSGTIRAVRQVIVSVGDTGDEWGPDGYFQVHRTDGTPDTSDPSNTLIGEHYLNNSNILIVDKPKFTSEALKIVIDHNAGVAKDVRVTVKYYYI